MAPSISSPTPFLHHLLSFTMNRHVHDTEPSNLMRTASQPLAGDGISWLRDTTFTRWLDSKSAYSKKFKIKSIHYFFHQSSIYNVNQSYLLNPIQNSSGLIPMIQDRFMYPKPQCNSDQIMQFKSIIGRCAENLNCNKKCLFSHLDAKSRDCAIFER